MEKNSKTGGAQQFIDEAERSIHDSIMIVKSATKNTKVCFVFLLKLRSEINIKLKKNTKIIKIESPGPLERSKCGILCPFGISTLELPKTLPNMSC